MTDFVTTFSKSHTWPDIEIPTPEASIWNCKFIVSYDEPALISMAPPRSYTELYISMIGFTEEVAVIIQPKGQFQNFISNDDNSVIKIFKGVHGSKIYAPINYDILINFMPIVSSDGATTRFGSFEVTARYILLSDEVI